MHSRKNKIRVQPNIRHIQHDDSCLNRWTLFFTDKEIEVKFRDDYFKKSIISFRVSFLLVTILYASFGFIDFQTSREFLSEFLIIRYSIAVPLMTLVILLSFFSFFKKQWQLLIAICYVVSGSGIAYMLLANPSNLWYYGGMFLIFIAGFFFIKLHFLWTAISGLAVLLFYNLAPFFFRELQFDLHYITISNAFFVATNLVSMAAVYNSQKLERQEFLQRMAMQQQQEEIKKINENLEEKVKERTELLETRNIVLNTEIKHRKEIEEKLLVAKHKAEESDRLKSAFLSNMSHEIRTPMNGIIGFLDLVADPDISKDEQDVFINIVKQSGNRLLQTINDIVEISKIESGELSENSIEVDLQKTFNYIGEFFSPEINEKKLSLVLPKIEQELVIKTDENKLESILFNLIKNAIKFTNTGSIEIGLTPNNDKLEFWIKDTGKGIPKDHFESIFDRFVQADNSLTRNHEGTGLGLSISKAYAEYLGGKIWLESEQNKGTTFHFSIDYLPITNTLTNNTADLARTNKMTNQKRITALVAEDDIVSFTLISTLLKNENVNVVHAPDGKKAVEYYQQNSDSIDLIFMDIKMPIMDGITATKQIRKFDNEVPIIAQTAFALSGDKEKALAAGCTDYLSKPIKTQNLVASLKHITEQ